MLELDHWRVPGEDNFDRYGISENWGDGAVIRPTDGSVEMYFRFYEWNLFGAVRNDLHTQADRTQRSEASWVGDTLLIEYPEEGISLSLEPDTDRIRLTLTVINRSEHDWPELATLIPCLTPGRSAGDPRVQTLADVDHTRTYFLSESGLELLDDREIHWHQNYFDRVDSREPEDGYPWDHKWPTSPRKATDPVMIRDSHDGQWGVGITWDDGISMQGHNPWWCIHLGIRVGPLEMGETKRIEGMIYLLSGGAEAVLKHYEREWAES